ncbi:hypothetical protein H2201_000608 [Coniosporium apollinis]|uniref:Fungal-type protein kinase domain-containing protein n=1 Tax=Coniosporium apollinis TaxID=61459 RepID=A0ABQ9P3T1_9PEZI|nr:hypothetical protein H2201_000608 [Coniosporium apollinis]
MGGKETVLLHSGSESTEYVIVKHGSTDMPTDEKRKGIFDSEIFIVQADFLLVANRGEIHKAPSWNHTIRDGITDVFLKAVHLFKNDEILRYEWPKMIPDPGQGGYFRKAPTTIELIDTSYLQANQGAQYKHWIQRLQSALEISGIPRSVNAEHQMTTEFKYLIGNEPSTFSYC